MKTLRVRSWTVAAAVGCCVVMAGAASGAKNVIVLVPDGVGSPGTTLLRWYRGAKSGQGANETLNLDRMALHGVRTYGANSLITDSAPAATAFACGYKSADKFVGMLPGGASAPSAERVTIPGLDPIPDELAYSPIASVLEAARLKGRKTGLVSTSNIQHATPAGYSAHTHNRGQYDRIAEQQVYGQMDVVLGAGTRYLDTRRADGENLIAVLASLGYQYVSNRAELAAATGPKVWGLFSDEAMAYEFDRQMLHPEQPSLAEMTRKAIDLLSADPGGFFLMVEGSKVDWADHANDPIGVISDLAAFDDAVGVALDYAEKKGNTLVLAFSDHGCGGMSLGSKATDATYSKLPLEALVDPLLPATLTGEGIGEVLGGDRSEANIRRVMSAHYGISDLTAAEVAAIAATPAGSMNYAVGPMISSRSVIGWTTSGHVGEDLFLYSYGLNKPLGLVENTEIAEICADALGVDLDQATASLYAEAIPALEAVGATVFVDASEPQNKVLVAQKGSTTVMFPLDKNLVEVSPGAAGRSFTMEGLTILAEKTGKVYLPQNALLSACKLLAR